MQAEYPARARRKLDPGPRPAQRPANRRQALTDTLRPFSRLEWQIAWAYLRARRREGGISVIAWYALIGVMLGVATLIVVQAVMIGFREEFTDRILGANPHVQVYSQTWQTEGGQTSRAIPDYPDRANALAAVAGVTSALPVIRGQVMASAFGRNAGVEVIGISPEDLARIPLVANPEESFGDLAAFPDGIALGAGVARELGLTVGDRIKLISPEGVKTVMGTAPRVAGFDVTYIFQVGRWDIDRTRVYLPLSRAQEFFNREGLADEIEIRVENPDRVEDLTPALMTAAGERGLIWTWKDNSGAFLEALDVERRVLFIILSLVVLIAALNIISGLVMLVKNKGRDIGILRTMGLSEGSVMRIFFICGSLIGVIGTALGVALGCVFALNISHIQGLVESISGGTLWDPSVRFLTEIPVRLRWQDVAAAMIMALALSFLITLLPARRAARLNPVEALRYE
jgi:lipoprotein-releasing system permease protein